MMDTIIQAGMASRYFVTDLKKGLAMTTASYIVISKELLSVDMLAGIFEKTFNSSILQKGIFKALVKKAEAKDIAVFLEELSTGNKASRPVIGVPTDLFIISNGIEKKALNAMKALKLRGLCQLLAVNISSVKVSDWLVTLESGLQEAKIVGDNSISIYRPLKRPLVVANLYKTIITTERDIKYILSNHPEMVGLLEPQNITNINDFIEEGKYDR